MKRATILHGTGGSPNECWMPWMKTILEASNYDVYAPTLPNNDVPNKNTYEEFLRTSGWNFTDNVLIGHSSGATTILNILSSDWLPHVEAVVLVGAFLNEKLTKQAPWYTPGQFDNLFLPSYDPAVLKSHATKFYFVHGDNDPFCDIEDAKKLCNDVGGVFITIPEGHHLGTSSGIKQIPQLQQVMTMDGLLS